MSNNESETETNGQSENPFLAWSANKIKKTLDSLRKPGRPSKEVVQLKEALALQEPEVQEPEEFEKVWDDVPKRGRGKPSNKGGSVRSEKITIPPIETGILEITVRGRNSLIMHQWDAKSIRQIEDKQGQKSHKPRDKRIPEDEYDAARYITTKGKDGIPAICFKNAIVAAASFLPDVTKTKLKGCIYVQGDDTGLIAIKHSAKKPTLRRDMVRIGGMSKTADVRYRPEYHNWEVTLSIEFDSTVISAEQVVNLVSRAGFNVGVGEWRPQYGRFNVVRV